MSKIKGAYPNDRLTGGMEPQGEVRMPAYIATPRSPLPDGWESGDRVRTTDAFASQFPGQPRAGMIVGGSREPGCCRVRLDGHRSAVVISFGYLTRE